MTLDLTDDEALVLFELLSRWGERGGLIEDPEAACFEHEAEFMAIHAVLCRLEAELVAPFQHDYGALLANARERLCPSEEGPVLTPTASFPISWSWGDFTSGR